jgi:hypothetical protein
MELFRQGHHAIADNMQGKHGDVRGEKNAKEVDLPVSPRDDASSIPRSCVGLFRQVLIGAFLAFVLGLVPANRDAVAAEIDTKLNAAADSPSSLTDCTTRTLDLLKLKIPPSLADIKQSTEICYYLLQRQGMLKDFSVRALTYEQQYRANGILLWMVVCITVSGVILAGFQLFAAYRLAIASGNAISSDTQLTLARNQIALKSSVTGLSVMLLSFAFFLVFVRYVYKIDDPQANLLPVQGTIDSPMPKGQGEPRASTVP